MRALSTMLATGVLGAAVLVAGPASADGADVTRIMLVGDSVTQGKAGDHTWRYWLWKSLQAANKPVDFVGPRMTLRDESTAYADPDFDQDHAARWGAMMTEHGWWVSPYPEDRTQDLVGTYRADVVVDDLGVNNLLLHMTPEQVIDRAESFVADVHAANPRATVVFGQLTQTWFDGVAAYNGLLLDMAAALDRPDARVLVALAPPDYTVADTYDTSHPNAQGEVKIAGQFFDVLSTLPPPVRPTPPLAAYSGVAALHAAPRRHAVRLDFTVPVEATGQAIWKRDVTRHGRWRLETFVDATRDHYKVRGLRRHHRYAFKLLAYRGAVASTRYSSVDRARVR